MININIQPLLVIKKTLRCHWPTSTFDLTGKPILRQQDVFLGQSISNQFCTSQEIEQSIMSLVQMYLPVVRVTGT